MDKKSTMDLINAIKTLKEINFQQFKIIRDYLVLNSNLTKEWLQFHSKILMKLINEVNELMKIIPNKNISKEFITNSDKDLKQSLQKNLEIDKKVQQILKEFQLNENDLSQKLLEFDYILDEIKDSLN